MFFRSPLTNSAEFGIVDQSDYFDHDVANKNNLYGYYIIRNDDFVYNPRISVTAPVGPVSRNKLGKSGVISPLYTAFRIHDIDPTYLEEFFKTSYWHLFMKTNGNTGARSDRFAIKDEVFFKLPVPCPEIREQKLVGGFLNTLDSSIVLHQREFFTSKPKK
jgi:type I restriction enzyme, S subunit